MQSQVANRFVEVARINTTIKQEDIIANSMINSAKAPYSVVSNNCATAVENALLSAGLIEARGHIMPGMIYNNTLASPLATGSTLILQGQDIPAYLLDFDGMGDP